MLLFAAGAKFEPRLAGIYWHSAPQGQRRGQEAAATGEAASWGIRPQRVVRYLSTKATAAPRFLRPVCLMVPPDPVLGNCRKYTCVPVITAPLDVDPSGKYANVVQFERFKEARGGEGTLSSIQASDSVDPVM